MASGTLLVVQAVLYSWNNSRQNTTEETSVAESEEARSNRFGRKIAQHGGPVIFGFKIARLIGCLTLFSLSFATLFLDSGRPSHQGLVLDWDRLFLVDNLPQIAMIITFVSLIAINLPYNMLRRRIVVYFLPCYDFSCSEQLESILNAS